MNAIRATRRTIPSLFSAPTSSLLFPGPTTASIARTTALHNFRRAMSSSAPASQSSPSPATPGARAKQPEWRVPTQVEKEPTLKVYNSLTRSKNEFIPTRGKQVTWYNCGPTVYDSSHMGHARNYVTQDIVRRILRDYFGYDVHFVMNVTDIDDKIIVRARQQHLLSSFRSSNATLTPTLLSTVQSAWSAHFVATLGKSPALTDVKGIGSLSQDEVDAAWKEVKERKSNPSWVKEATVKDQKFGMNFAALDSSRDALTSAAAALQSGDTSKTQAELLINASQDALASYLDKQHGSTVTDPAIFRSLAARWERSFFEDMAALHVERPDTLTRVSEYIPEIVAFVERIVSNGFAYADEQGNVWFDTKAFDGGNAGGKTANGEVSSAAEDEWKHVYAKLQPWSKGNKELLDEGEGSLTAASGKRCPSDFALWKTSKPGEPAWDSPWGPGRPGWHIECSVMASEVFGSGMDIHSGGVDLMFPHHDNEIAQSEAYHDCRQWVNYFLHTGHLHIEGLKMSKSLKNFITIEEALQKYTPRQLRLAFLQQLWSSKTDFRESGMVEVRNTETFFNNFFTNVKALRRKAQAQAEQSDGRHHYDAPEKELMSELKRSQSAFRAALCDSFNTPDALSVLLGLVSTTNVYIRERTAVDVGVVEAVAAWVTRMLRMFGLGEGPVREGDLGWGEAAKAGEGDVDRESVLMPYLAALSSFRDDVRRLALARAPHQELLALADRLRDEDMVELGVALDDQADGKALIRLVSAEELIRAREAARAAAAEKAAKKAAAAAAAEAKRREKLEKSKVPPQEMFKPPHNQDGYQAFDEQGLPTLDAKGEELSKGLRKKLAKLQEAQAKLHEEYLKSVEGAEK